MDTILAPLIELLRKGGFPNQSDLVDELAERYGGDAFENALYVRQMEAESDRLAADFEERLRKNDIADDVPRLTPSPHVPAHIPVSSAVTAPAAASPTSTAPTTSPVVVQGRLVHSIVPATSAAPPVAYTGSHLFTTPKCLALFLVSLSR